MRRCLVLATVLMCPYPMPYAVSADRQPLAFSLVDSSDIVVAVTIAGRGPYRALLDTGAARSAVSIRVARDLALPAIGRTTLVTPAGRSPRQLVRTVIDLGGTPATADATVLADADLPRGIDGLIGADILAARRFTIDYLEQRIAFGSRADPGAVSVPLTHGGNGFVVVLPQHHPAPPLRLVPDTGTRTIVLIAREPALLPALTPLAPAVVRSMGRVRVGRSAVLEELRVGRIRLRDQPVIVIRDTSGDRLGDGLLPLHLFARVTFDAPGGLLALHARDGRGR